MTVKHNDTNKQPKESVKLILCVHVSSGCEKQHTFDIPSNLQEAKKEVDRIIGILVKALKGKLNYLQLPNPTISYSLPHIVFFEITVKGPKEWQELISKSIKEPIGYKTHS